MENTCMVSPIRQIICPILAATLPDTPVSISSKISVGMPSKRAIRAFRLSMMRDSSPPDAHLASSVLRVPSALNRNSTESAPVAPGAMLLADMIGLPVRDARNGRLYGTLTDVTDAPASALYTVTTPDGKEVLLPAVPAFVSRVDPAEGVLVTPIPGFFDEGGDDDAL